MRIAQIANNWGKFNPKTGIGIAAVIRDVSLGLIAKGHDVTVFAPNGSIFPGVKLRCTGKSFEELGINLFHPDAPEAQAAYTKEIASQLHDFDIIHSHIEHAMLPFIKDISVPVVSTIHGADFMSREKAIFQAYPDEIFIALSEGAKRALPYIHFSYVVHNGIRLDEATFVANSQFPAYLVWMGRFSENKGVLDAIDAARRAKETLFLVGFEEKGQEEYFQKVKHLADGSKIRIIDKFVSGQKKYSFLGNAKAFLFPIHWEEPFGLMMPESMACGTPVIAYNRGSVPDIVKDGFTGFIIDPDEQDRPGRGTWAIKEKGIAGLVKAVKKIGEIDRSSCRKHVEENFTVEKMVDNYERVYEKIIKG